MSCFRLTPSGHNGEVALSELADNGTDDALRLQEEEYRRKIELEAEERKLEETLEYQRQIENAAKLKHLAELHKRNSKIVEEKAEPIATSDVPLRCNDEERDVNAQWTNRKVSYCYPFPSIHMWSTSQSVTNLGRISFYQFSDYLCSFSFFQES